MEVVAIGKDASTTKAMMAVQQWYWHGHNDGKDAINRGNTTGNNQPVQQKDERADERSRADDTT